MVISSRQVFARTGTATAVALLLGAWASPATAFFAGDSRTSVHETSSTARPAPKASPTRAPVLASRSADKLTIIKSTAKPAPVANDFSKATGPLQIMISLDKQELTLYSDGERVARTRISSGQRGHPTPTGVFSVIQKNRWHRSNIYDDAPMFYMHRLTWSGIALHQGVVPRYPASHGCIRMPEAFAKKLWAISKLGARIVVARGEMTPVEITHPHLFMPKREPAVSMKQTLRVVPQSWTFAQLTNAAPLTSDISIGLPPLNAPAPAPSELSHEPTATAPDVSSPSSVAPDTATEGPAAPSLITKPLKSGPVSVFVSRKEGKLFVRKGFEPVFDIPVAIDRPAEQLGTHVFTAVNGRDGKALRWNVVSVPDSKSPTSKGPSLTATSALDRVTIPQEAVDQISELVGPGASLIISDQGLGPETGKGTDFIVLTR